MEKRRKILIASLGLSALTACAILGTTFGAAYAYFSDQAKGSVHVAAGSLKVKFERIGIGGMVPVAGELVPKEVDPVADYLDLTDDDVSVAYSVDNAMPGFDADLIFRVTNTASVNFSYVLSACSLTLGEGDASVELSKALQITIITSASVEYTFFAKDIPSEKAMNANMAPTATDVFHVKLKIDEEVGNEIQLGGLTFDLQVKATQVHA